VKTAHAIAKHLQKLGFVLLDADVTRKWYSSKLLRLLPQQEGPSLESDYRQSIADGKKAANLE